MALEILTMDLSSTMIASALCLVVVLISYLIYKFGIAEKSFEEVIEEQKRRSIEEEMQQKLEKSKKEKKFKRNWGKKKEKAEPEVVHEPVQVEDKKDAMPSFEIIEPKEVKPPKQKAKAKSNTSPPTSVVTESTSVAEKPKKADVAAVADKVQDKKKEVQESVKEVEKVKSEPKVTESTKVITNEINETSSSGSSVMTTSVPAVTSSKKKKKEQVEKDVIPMTTSKLLSLIKETELDTEEIQNLIDILLNKQKDSTSWTKKNDQLAITKKNLQEKEQLLDQEQRQTQAVTTKLKDLREEYNLLKSKMTAQEKISQEKLARQQQDIQGLNLRVKQLQEQLNAEKDKYAEIEKSAEEKLEASVKKYEDEKVKLQQKIAKLETESHSGVSKTELETIKKAKEDLQKVHSLLIEQHTQLISSHKNELKAMNAQLADAKAQVEKVNAKNIILLNDIQTLNDTKAAIELSKASLEEKLKAEERHSADLEAQIKQLTAKVTDFTQLQTELKDLRLENERLAEQLVSTKERVAGDGQEIVHQNGELNGKAQEEISLKLDEKDKLLQEKEVLLAQLNEELNKQKARIAVLSAEIEVQKSKNNELREKNWKAMDALTNAEKNAELKVKEIQTASEQKLVQLQKEYEEKCQSSDIKDSKELTIRLEKAENEAAHRLSDYNSELEKNKKLTSEIERIGLLHKSSEQRIVELEKSVQDLNSALSKSQSHTKECLQRICPNVSVDNSLPYDLWLEEFEKLAVLAVQAIASSTDSKELESRLQQVLEEKEKELLENKRYYDRILDETLSTLQELQGRAESQDALWQERLNKKELELQQALSEKDSLVAEKDAMQSTLQQLSQLEELQEKLRLLQVTLEKAEGERSHLEQKYEEVNKNYINLKDQLENKEKHIMELEKERSSSDRFKQEVEDLKCKLEKERKITKNFSSEMVRLNSLVKIGQDALTAEQEMVKKLKHQLETSQVSTANGTASATISSPITNSESQQKTKSSEKSKKKTDASVKK